jgi:hypothetical protein
MHEDHDVSRHARRKDTLSAEDLGILLQWHWKYGTSTFANERQLGRTIRFSIYAGNGCRGSFDRAHNRVSATVFWQSFKQTRADFSAREKRGLTSHGVRGSRLFR